MNINYGIKSNSVGLNEKNDKLNNIHDELNGNDDFNRYK